MAEGALYNHFCLFYPQNDPGHVWIRADLRKGDGEARYFGAMRFVGRDIRLSPDIIGFAEVYGFPVNKLPDSIPTFAVAFGNYRLNDKPVEPTSLQAEYPADVPSHAVVHTAARYAKLRPEVKDLLPTSRGSYVIAVTAERVRRKQAKERLELESIEVTSPPK